MASGRSEVRVPGYRQPLRRDVVPGPFHETCYPARSMAYPRSVIAGLQEWLSDPSRQVGIVAVLVIAAIGHLMLAQWVPVGGLRQAAEFSFALFLFLGVLSVSRAQGWGSTIAWIAVSAATASVLGVALASASS